MDYVAMYPETFEAVRRYSPQDRCFLYEAMGQYAFTGELPAWAEDDLKWYVWEALKQRIDAAIRLSGARRASGIRGGEASASKRKQVQANASKTNQTQAIASNGNPESESESDIESDSKEKSKRKERRFAPPTVEEVEAYIREKGYSVDAQKFVDYYESNGWKVGRNPMKDWKAALRTWQANQFDRTPPQKKTVVAQQYEQRDYSQDKPEPVPEWMLERWQAMQKEGTA